MTKVITCYYYYLLLTNIKLLGNPFMEQQQAQVTFDIIWKE